MRKIIAALLLWATLSAPTFAQISGSYGPGPAPDPWVFNGYNLSYSQGGISLPSTVTGGDKGVGSLNVQHLYINGASFTIGGALTITGAGPTTFALPTGAFTFTFPALTGTMALLSNNLGQFASTTSAQLAGIISNETGSGNLVFATSPTLITPVLGVATATTINGNAITTGTGTLTLGAGKTLTASNTLTLAGTDGSTLSIGGGGTLGTAAFANTGTSGAALPLLNGTNTWSAVNTFGSGDLSATAPVLAGTVTGTYTLGGTPTITAPTLSGTVGGTYTIGAGATWNGIAIGTAAGGLSANNSAATGIPVFSTGVATVTATTGTGAPVRATAPTLVTPVLGAATATSVNFGGTSLATYVEGTWTPVLRFGGATTGITYTTQVGSYVQVGKSITAQFSIVLSSVGSATGAASIAGLPVPNSATVPASGSVGGYTALSGLTGSLFLGAVAGASAVSILQSSATAQVSLTNANFTSTSVINGVISYVIN
jgi:hypothetical protein